MPGRVSLDRCRRRGRVVDIVARSKHVGVDELSRELAVSRGTIQADLRDLEAAGHLRRVWGGAQPVAPAAVIPPSVDHVCSMAAALMHSWDTVLLACGSASAGVAAALVARRDLTGLTVVTGDLFACERFAEHSDRFEVRVTESVLHGGSLVPVRAAGDAIRFAVDIALLPCHRIDSRGRVHLTGHQLAAISVLDSVEAGRTVLVSTGDVFTATGGELWSTIGDVDAVIAGATSVGAAVDGLRAAGAEIIIASSMDVRHATFA